jgi:hypothetical protein
MSQEARNSTTEQQTITSKTNSTRIEAVMSAINALRFGSVEITVHEGRVTQIEKREKVRFSDSANNPIKPTEKSAAKTVKDSC